MKFSVEKFFALSTFLAPWIESPRYKMARTMTVLSLRFDNRDLASLEVEQPRRLLTGGRKANAPATERLYNVLRWMHHPDTFRSLEIDTGLSRSTLWSDVLQCIVYALRHEIMWPSAEERKIISQSVALSAGKSSSRSFLAGAVGIIDGFEVQVPRPKDRVLNDLLYSGKKGCHTLNTLIVIDFKRYIRYFVAGIPGKFNDRAVWTSSPLYLNARDFFSDGEYLLADGGFEGHGANLLYSYKMPRSELEIEFNSAFTDIRKNVECGIGDVKAWAHVLQGNMWNFDLTLFGLVVHVSCLLHNYKLRTGIRCIVSMLYANIRILGMKYT